MINTYGLDDLMLTLAEIAEIPDDVQEEMLRAGGDVVVKAQKRTAQSMLHGPYDKGAVVKAVFLGKSKKTGDGREAYINFRGSQHDNRLAEIAFVNEFGKQNQPARPFINTANEESADEATEAGAKIYDKWLDSKGL